MFLYDSIMRSDFSIPFPCIKSTRSYFPQCIQFPNIRRPLLKLAKCALFGKSWKHFEGRIVSPVVLSFTSVPRFDFREVQWRHIPLEEIQNGGSFLFRVRQHQRQPRSAAFDVEWRQLQISSEFKQASGNEQHRALFFLVLPPFACLSIRRRLH